MRLLSYEEQIARHAVEMLVKHGATRLRVDYGGASTLIDIPIHTQGAPVLAAVAEAVEAILEPRSPFHETTVLARGPALKPAGTHWFRFIPGNGLNSIVDVSVNLSPLLSGLFDAIKAARKA